MSFSRWLLVGTLLLAVGCGRSKTSPDRVAATTLPTGKAAVQPARWGAAFERAGDGRTPAACAALADGIAGAIATERSVVILRFDYQSKRPLGFAQLNTRTPCSFYAETRARVCAKADPSLRLPFDPTTQGTWLRGESGDRGPWVFHQLSPERGGVIVVDDDFGTVFSASIPRKGEGEVLVPSAWNSKDVGVGCRPAKQDTAPTQAWDLRGGTRMPAAESEALAALARRTVLPGLWESWGGDSQVFLALLVPRTAGDFDPRTAEYLVFMRGWTSVP